MAEEEPTSIPIVIPDSDEDLLAECRVETFRSGGPGGQHQNTSDSGVRLVHEPTGIRVVARDERSQHRNRALALQRLRQRLEALNRRPTPRVPTSVPKREKRKRLEEKRRRGEVKRRRKPPEGEEG
jgi:ribosome-associated protein